MITIVIPWPILHLIFILWFSSTLARNLEIPRYETAYACEGKMLKIECKDGELIRLIRANYGRFSITICNDHGNTDWSVNCMSPKSLRVLHNRCSQNQNCSILASTATFGDPCAGTLKYLEAHYQCMPATITTTTNRPSPPWLITSQPPNVWNTVKPTTRSSLPRESLLSSSSTATLPPIPVPALAAKTSPNSTSSMGATSQKPGTQIQPSSVVPGIHDTLPQEVIESIVSEMITEIDTTTYSKKQPEDSTINYSYVSSPSSSWFQEEIIHYCPPTQIRNLYWNWTRINERTVQPCPGGATGLARWRCVKHADDLEEPRWFPPTPDLSECRSVWLTSLESRVIEGDSLISITSDLSQVTSSKTLYGGDMMITTKIIKKMAQKMAEDIQTFPDQRQREAIVTELLHGVVRTGSNLLDSSQHPSWRDLSYKEQMRVATSLLIGLEENAFLLADTVIREKTVVQTVKNIMLSVRVLETKNIKTETFPSEAVNDKWNSSNDWLQLPREALLENSEGGLVRLVFVAFDHLEEILQWQPESALEYSGSHKNLSRVLNSKIISASLGKGRHIQLSQPVRLSLRHLKMDNVSNPSCVFWDYTMSTWSEEGCQVESTNRTHTTCLCDHLTNFAILMDVHATYLPVAHQMALQIITYIGCIISIGCLILTIITFQTFRGLKSDRTTIHKNLCFCLLFAELLFVVGIARTSDRILCGVIAALLQLLFLCAFSWMFLEGFQLYVMLVEVFEAEKSRIRWYYLVAYGIPLFIVATSALIDPFSYGTEQYCWLRADNFFIFSFVGPVIIVLLANLIFLAMAIVMMCRHGNTSVTMKNKEHSRLASARTWLRGAFVLVFLLGLTWTFGLLFLNKESVVMAYIFSTLNSLQGLFIFVFHCIQNEKVRKEYRKFIRRQSWLPKCLRCMKSQSGSSVLSKERRTSLYGGSNGNTSAPNSHSTDNSGLSPYGTSVGTSVNNIVISNNLNFLTNLRPTPLIQVLNHHNNNISFKSYSRDSGHGGSEQEESPRSRIPITDRDGHLTVKDTRRQPYISELDPHANLDGLNVGEAQAEISNYLHKKDSVQKQISQGLQQHMRKKLVVGPGGNCFLRSGAVPWNHTYTEIHDERMRHCDVRHSEDDGDTDPVYEEIERGEIQDIHISDISDEDGKRQSDMSRQSSRSYGDHRPLIPHSPATMEHVSHMEHQYSAELEHHYRIGLGLGGLSGWSGLGREISRHNMYRGGVGVAGENARSLAAVLDGETVVCHLEPPEFFAHDLYNSRTVVMPPNGES